MPEHDHTRLPLQIDRTGGVPRWIAEHGYREYVRKYGRSQSFDRLHERGGFGHIELLTLLAERIERLEATDAEGGPRG